MAAWLGVFALLAIAGIAAALAAWPRLRGWCTDRAAHRRLASANGLTDAERAWLWRLARQTAPERPALVFVRPSLLDSPAAVRDTQLADSVRAKLFSD